MRSLIVTPFRWIRENNNPRSMKDLPKKELSLASWLALVLDTRYAKQASY